MSSLECGNIAIPRDLFTFLVIPRNTYVFMSTEQREKLKYIPAQYDPEEKECYLNVKFKEVEKYIPQKIFQKAWDDNNAFASERQLNNSDFLTFFRNLLGKEDLINQQDDQNKLSLLYDL